MFNNDLLSAKALARCLGIGITKARQIVNEGIGTYTVFIGKRKYVLSEAFDNYIKQQANQKNINGNSKEE